MTTDINPDLLDRLAHDRAAADTALDGILTLVREGIAEFGVHEAAADLVLVLSTTRPETVAWIAMTAILRLAQTTGDTQ